MEFVTENLSRKQVENMLLSEINHANPTKYWLNDIVIYSFLTVFKRNTDLFDFVDPLYSTHEDLEEKLSSI